MNTRIEKPDRTRRYAGQRFHSSDALPARLRTGEPVDIFDGGNYAIVAGNSTQQDLQGGEPHCPP